MKPILSLNPLDPSFVGFGLEPYDLDSSWSS
jgi:hypothetical protein